MYVLRNTFKNRVDLLLTGKEGKRHYVLIKNLNYSCMIINYSTEENIFIITVYTFLVKKTYGNFLLMTVLKWMVNRRLRCLKKWIN